MPREAAHAVERLLGDARDQATRERVSALAHLVAAEARTAENNQKLLDKLIDIRSATEDDPDYSLTDAAYANAFREAGIDALALQPSEFGARIKGLPATVTVTLSAALDDWARVRRDKRHDRPGAARLSHAARAADPDPWRNRLRDALDAAKASSDWTRCGSSPARRRSTNYRRSASTCLDRRCARQAMQSGLRPSFAERSAAALMMSGSIITSQSALKSWPGARKRSASTWRHARSDPRSRHELAHALDNSREPEEAIAVFQELTRIRPGNGRHLRCLGLALRRRGRRARPTRPSPPRSRCCAKSSARGPKISGRPEILA